MYDRGWYIELFLIFCKRASVIHRLPGCGLTGYPLGFHRLVTMNQTPPARAINLTRVLDLKTCFVYESKVTFLWQFLADFTAWRFRCYNKIILVYQSNQKLNLSLQWWGLSNCGRWLALRLSAWLIISCRLVLKPWLSSCFPLRHGHREFSSRHLRK